MSQTSYSASPAAHFAGQLANSMNVGCESMINGSGDDQPFGIAVVRTSTYNVFDTVQSADDVVAGVLVHTHARKPSGLTGTNGVEDTGNANVINFGDVYVLPEQTVVIGDPVFVRFSAGVGEQLGAFRKDADTADARELVGAEWVKGGTTTSPAILRLRLSMPASATDSVTLNLAHAQNTNAGDQSNFMYVVPAGRSFILDEAWYYNATGLVADNDNFATISVKKTTTVMASLLTDADGGGATISAATATEMTNASEAARTASAGEVITFHVAESGTTTVPAGSVVVTGRLL